MNKSVINVYDEPTEATQVVEALTQAGFNRQNIRLVSNMAAGANLKSGANIVPTLEHLGVPTQDAGDFAEVVRRGGSLVAVIVPEKRLSEAQEIIHRFGSSVDVEDRVSRLRNAGYQAHAHDQPAYTADQARTEREQLTIPIVAEQLQVGKREVERGGVRVHSRVIEKPVEAHVTLREEEVNIDRHSVNRPLAGAALQNAFQEGVIEITETGEEAVISKQARVVEEVVIDKQATERTQTIQDTVRRTEVDVEELDSSATTTSATSPKAR